MYTPETWGIANLPSGETVVHGESPEWEINTQAPPFNCNGEPLLPQLAFQKNQSVLSFYVLVFQDGFCV